MPSTVLALLLSSSEFFLKISLAFLDNFFHFPSAASTELGRDFVELSVSFPCPSSAAKSFSLFKAEADSLREQTVEVRLERSSVLMTWPTRFDCDLAL